MDKKYALPLLITVMFIAALGLIFFVFKKDAEEKPIFPSNQVTNFTDGIPNLPMSIKSLGARDYPASKIIIEETLEPGSNYQRFIASYQSDGYKIYGLFTLPNTKKPDKGFPTIVFLHGYLRPATYVTTADYKTTQDGLARNGFITFKPDFRGHGQSEGEATGAHFSEAYTVDTLNAISALERYKNVDFDRIGLWGHSNGGEIGLRVMVVTNKIKAAVFWAGVVGSYQDMLETYNSQISFLRRRTAEVFEKYGSPSANPDYWNKIDPYFYLENISAPIQLHHGTADSSVPVELSRSLSNALEKSGKEVKLYEYEGADHNMNGASFSLAMARSVEFFKKYLKETN
ncbi:alpha/beta hydrolase family protein [Patescibacteria group bacterium]